MHVCVSQILLAQKASNFFFNYLNEWGADNQDHLGPLKINTAGQGKTLYKLQAY